jgi:KaiC/GvpD/RAD55 family RecA-like ATPase
MGGIMSTMKIDLATTVVLGGIMRLKEVRERYLQLFTKSYSRAFGGDSRSVYASIESVISTCIRSDIDVSFDVIMNYLVAHYDKLPPTDSEYKLQFATILEELSKDLKYTPNICFRHLEAIAKDRAATKLKTRLLDPSNKGNMQEAIEEYVEETAKVESSDNGLKVYHPFKDRQKLLRKKKRVPTGVSVIDSILQGGIVPGEHLGILGPSSGGKTIIANQLVCNLAIRKMNTLIVQFEQPVDGDITERMFSYLTGRPITDFRDKSIDEWSDEVLADVEKVAHIMDYIRSTSYHDQSASIVRNGTQEFIKDLQQVYDGGFKFKFLVIDWLGAAVTGFMRASQAKFFESAEIFMDDVNKWAKQNGVTIIWLHQTTTDAQRREPAYKPVREDAYKFGAFCHKIEFCLQLGTPTRRKDGTNVHYLCIGKGRTASLAKDHIVVKMLGAMMRFEEAEPDEFVLNKKGQFVTKAEHLGLDKEDYEDDDVYLPPKNSAEAFTNGYM